MFNTPREAVAIIPLLVRNVVKQLVMPSGQTETDAYEIGYKAGYNAGYYDGSRDQRHE